MTDEADFPSQAGVDRLGLLQTFLAVVDAGSLSAAALRLGSTQPTVSRRLQLLERLLGLRLFQRSTRGVTLTEDGARCAASSRDLVARWTEMTEDLRAGGEVARGPLRVVAPHAFGQGQLIGPLVAFLRAHPQVSIEWLLHDRAPDFAREGVDCAIHVGPVEDEGLVAIRLAEVPRVVVAAPALVAECCGGVPPGIDALGALPWLALKTYYYRATSLRHAGSGAVAELAFAPRLATDSLFALRSAALAGLGVAIVSAWTVVDDLAEGRLLHLVPDWQAAPLAVHLVYPPAPWLPARLRAFIALMREHMPAMAGVVPPTLRSG
ncbi:LysR family transcriptional regulator [Derxia lacustris]|uniref:LysR family transcriptional regulator n=1 Tax=Derxia lacustris TaxID=764842 RepID=UPI000A16ED8C|nr:LysR family transcriptional regulator [Derxia lacustris]